MNACVLDAFRPSLFNIYSSCYIHFLLGVIIKKSTNLYPLKVHCDYLFTSIEIIFITEKYKINLELKINKVKLISVISILVVVKIDMIRFIFDRKK